MKRTPLLFLLMALVCLQGCESDQNTVAPTLNQVKNVNGRLVFGTKDVASTTLTELTNKPSSDLSAWEDKYDFKSLRSLIDPHDPEIDTFLLMYPPQLASVLNSAREYQVENTVVWFYKNFVFKVPVDNLVLLERIKTAPESDEFSAYRELFIDRQNSEAFANGRVLPSWLAATTMFYFQHIGRYNRFVRDFRVLNTGSNYQIELVNCLQYRNASNGGWYLYDYPVNVRKIESVYLNGVYTPLSATAYDTGGYLRLTIYTSPTPFSGTISAVFTHELWDYVQNKWITFSSKVTWY